MSPGPTESGPGAGPDRIGRGRDGVRAIRVRAGALGPACKEGTCHEVVKG
jgi:hypothetical protein